MMTEVFFNDIKSEIKRKLLTTKSELNLAIAWFTDYELFQIILGLAKKGVKVELILNDDLINQESKNNFEELYKSGGRVWYPKESEYLMHNKFCVIDNSIILTGSYNWTNKALHNNENITVIQDETIAANFKAEFEKIKNKCYGIEKYLNIEIAEEDVLEDIEILISRAESRKEIENYQASISDYKKLLSITQDPAHYFDIAYCYAHLDNTEAAIDNYSIYLNNFPEDSSALNNRALLYEKKYEFEKSLADYDLAIQIDPKDPKYHSNKADLLSSDVWKLNLPILFLSVMEKDFNSYMREVGLPVLGEYESKYKRCQLYEKSAKESIACYKKSIELSNECDCFYELTRIADIYSLLGEYSDSIVYYTKCISLQKKANLYYERGFNYYYMDEYKNALMDVEIAYRLNPIHSYKNAVDLMKKKIRQNRWKLW